jgi:hypothetical protein
VHRRGNKAGKHGATRSAFLALLVRVAPIAFAMVNAHAELPRQVSAFGIALGQTPEAVHTILGKQYPNCALLPSVYHESAGYSPDPLAILDIARGTMDVCRTGATGREVEDSLSATFAHPSIDPRQPLYQIDVQRGYPDVALVRNSKVQYPFDKIRAELFRTYGKPIETRREKISSAAADFAKSLALDMNVRREDFLVRYLWAAKGRLDENRESTQCDCGPRYVHADLEVSRSPSTSPSNQEFVLTLHIFVRDEELGSRQDTWNAQWQQQKEERK